MAGREKRNRSKGSVGNNRKSGEDFLEKNRKKPGVVQTGSGLQYIVLEEGEGNCPQENAYLTVHQRCQLLNGTILIDTYKENKPDEVKMEELIPGYQEGLQLMKKGSRYKLFVPPDLGWGKKGSENKIPPNAVLVFDIRLIDFW